MRTTIAALLLGCLGLAACSPPEPPDEERRPEPQAEGMQAQAKSGIVQTADAYKDRARSAEAQQLEAAERQRAQLDAATQ
jgi:hypothetical protein